MAAFLLGAVAGSLGVVAAAGREVQRLQLEREVLLQRLEQQRTRLENLEQALARHRQPVIGEARLELLGVDDPVIRLALERQLQPLVQDLVGRRLDRVDPELVASIFEGRSLAVGERRYTLSLRRLLLAEQTSLQLVVRRAEQDSPRP
jgi:hypothetical protein